MNTTVFISDSSSDLLDVGLRRELLPIDRCDACGARAWVRAVMKSSELLFCGHHATMHLDALSKEALFIQDDRDLMEEEG